MHGLCDVTSYEILQFIQTCLTVTNQLSNYVNCSISHSLMQPNLLKLHLSQQARRMLLQGRQLRSQSKPLVQSLWTTSGSVNHLERRVRRMGGRNSLVKVAHFKWEVSRRATQATIGVWSPTLLGVKLHCMPASLLVSILYCHCK